MRNHLTHFASVDFFTLTLCVISLKYLFIGATRKIEMPIQDCICIIHIYCGFNHSEWFILRTEYTILYQAFPRNETLKTEIRFARLS